MTVGEFRMTFPGRDVPRDLALYDRQLLVAYDESRLILRFDVVRREADVCRLFDDVMEMISRHTPTLKRVELASALQSGASSAVDARAQDGDQRH